MSTFQIIGDGWAPPKHKQLDHIHYMMPS